MMARWKLFLLCLFAIGLPSQAMAIMIETDEMRLGINGYLNVVYEYMGKMAAVTEDGTGIETLSDSSTFENDTHLIFNAVKDRLRTNLNIEFHNGYFSEGKTVGGVDENITRGEFLLLEVFGEYSGGPYLQVRAGQFLSPFGIYNHIRYVTPLFASVELPMMYHPPENYRGEDLVPDPANLMVSGGRAGDAMNVRYAIYLGNGGNLTAHGTDKNKDKGVGGRVHLETAHLKFGGSYYNVADDPVEGRESLIGLDLEATLGDFNIQGEYAIDRAENEADRFGYYVRMTIDAGRYAPFAAYDYLKDQGDILFDRGMHRYSAGLGYTVNNHITLKGEYHYHLFGNDSGLAGAPEDIQMFMAAAIFIF